ncbi:hypothetical protein FSP39_000863 [Pinctada imbricata]|uniref:Serine hydrolase domain-containing protein n=1 Tax=Pinctada imbricata TaxID=66713 RepID=A0AA89CDN6_PINIB|nr:hypothetical protein FSP39_000863 [Pinctada imbricata]
MHAAEEDWIKVLNSAELEKISRQCRAELVQSRADVEKRQNAQSFKEKTGSFRKIVKKHAEFVFITAPNRVPAVDQEVTQDHQTQDNDERGWWFSTGDRSYNAKDFTDCCHGYQESVEVIKQSLIEQGPFDGILAFSQGAAMLSLICGLQKQNPDGPFKFDFVILIAGFRSRQKPHDELYSQKFTVPSLHVFGDTDKVIPKDMSEDILQYYTDPVILQHPGGHFIPTSAPQKSAYTQFLDNFLRKKNDDKSSNS